MKRSMLTAAITALMGMFPMAFLTTLLWRFPMPMGGYESGLVWAVKSQLAVVFYIIFGGFIVLPLFGALAGMLAFRQAAGDAIRSRKLAITYGLACSLVACVILASLDKIIGAW